MNLQAYKNNLRAFGPWRATADVALRAVNRVAVLRILKGIRIERVDPAFLDCDSCYRGQFLDEQLLREFARDPRNELSPAFLDRALRKGDECYGFLAGATLAAYGWYSRRPTALDVPGLQLHFDDRYVYMYKGFTSTEHRGKRLHAVGMTRALQSYLERGYRGIVSYVEWDNFSSLKSCYRMGYRDFGNVVIAGTAGQYLIHCSSGCRELAFRVVRTEARREPWIPSKNFRSL